MILALCVTFTFYNCEYENNLVGNWKGPTQMNSNGRGGASCFVIDNMAYIVGGRGYIKRESFFLDTWQFDPKHNSWKQYAPVPAEKGRNYGVAFAAIGADGKTKGYYGTGIGYKSEVFKDFYEFSPEDSTTVPVLSVEGDTTGYKKLPGVWTVTDSLPGEEPIWGMVGFTINGVGYIGAGQTKNQGYANTYYSYNPNAAKGKKWQIVEHINPAKRCYGSVFVIDDRAYIVGGISNGKYVYDLERFDPSIDEGEFRWQKITQNFVEDYRSSRFVKVYRQQAAAFSINGRGYLCCGSVGSSKSDVWEYIPYVGRDNMGEWTEVCSFEGSPRFACLGFAIDGVGYVGTGTIVNANPSSQDQFYDDLWEFHPDEDYEKRPDR